MQSLGSPSLAPSVTEEPHAIDGNDVASIIQNPEPQTAVVSAVHQSRSTPRQRRLDTEDGGHATPRNKTPKPSRSRQRSSRIYNENYYWGCGITERVEKGATLWEDELYEQSGFKAVMLLVLIAMMAIWTIAAIEWL